MGKKRFVAAAVVAGVLALAGYALPLSTTVKVIDIDINIIVLFRLLWPFFLSGALLDIVAIWGQRVVPGKAGEFIAKRADGIVPAFVYMVPAEVTYIILFVALTIHSAVVWDSGLFSLFFFPVILLLPFIFHPRTGKWLWRKWLWAPWYRFWKMERVPESPVPWGFLLTNALQAGLYAGILGSVVTLVDDVFTNALDWRLVGASAIVTVVIFTAALALGYLKWKHPDPRSKSRDA